MCSATFLMIHDGHVRANYIMLAAYNYYICVECRLKHAPTRVPMVVELDGASRERMKGVVEALGRESLTRT